MSTLDRPRNGSTSDRPIPGPRIVLTVEEAAEALGIGRSLMYELIGSGAVESVQIGRLRRGPADALGEYVSRLRADSRGQEVVA